jgi:hypothetical protein
MCAGAGAGCGSGDAGDAAAGTAAFKTRGCGFPAGFLPDSVASETVGGPPGAAYCWEAAGAAKRLRDGDNGDVARIVGLGAAVCPTGRVARFEGKWLSLSDSAAGSCESSARALRECDGSLGAFTAAAGGGAADPTPSGVLSNCWTSARLAACTTCQRSVMRAALHRLAQATSCSAPHAANNSVTTAGLTKYRLRTATASPGAAMLRLRVVGRDDHQRPAELLRMAKHRQVGTPWAWYHPGT